MLGTRTPFNYIGIALVLILTLQACSNENEQIGQNLYIVPEDSLVALLVDIHTLDAGAKQNLIDNNSSNYQKHRQYKAVLNQHNISKARFDSTLNYYSVHFKEFEDLYTTVIDSLTKAEKSLSK